MYPELWQIKAPPLSNSVQGWNHGGLLSTSTMVTRMVVEAVNERPGAPISVSWEEAEMEPDYVSRTYIMIVL